MDEKIMNLLEKVYIELQDTKKELRNDIKKLEIKIEHEVSDKVKILFEAHDGDIERLDRIEDTLHSISHEEEWLCGSGSGTSGMQDVICNMVYFVTPLFMQDIYNYLWKDIANNIGKRIL